MKTLIAIILTLTAIAVKAQSSSITVAWNPNATTDNVTNYIVGIGTSHTNYAVLQNTGTATTWTVGGLSQGQTYYIAVKAQNVQGVQSVGWSNEVTNSIPTIPANVTGNRTVLIIP